MESNYKKGKEMKEFIAALCLIGLGFSACDNNTQDEINQNYFDEICLKGHGYFYHRGVGGYSYLAPMLNDNGTPVKCKVKKEIQ